MDRSDISCQKGQITHQESYLVLNRGRYNKIEKLEDIETPKQNKICVTLAH